MIQENTILRVLKNAIALFAGKAFLMAFSFFFYIYAARLLGVEDFGKYALVRGYFELFLSLCTAGLMNVITREIAKRNETANAYMNSAFMMASGLVVVGSLILIVIGNVSPYTNDTRVAIYLACLALIPAGLTMIFQAGFVAFEKAEYTTYGIVIENLTRTSLSIGALYLGLGLQPLFIIMILSRSIMLGFYWIAWNRKIAQLVWYYSLDFIKGLAKEWRIFAVEGWMSDIFGSIDLIVLSFLLGEAAVGLYSAAYRVIGIGSMVANSYTTATFPYMSQLWVENKEKFRRFGENSLKYMIAMILPAMVTLAVLGDRIIVLLFTDEYIDAVPLFRILAWVLVLRFVNPFLSYMLFAQGRQRKSLQVISITLSVYVVNLFWMTKLWDATGTALALLTSMILAFSQYYWFTMGRKGFSSERLAVYGRIALLAASVGALTWLLRDFYLVPLGIVILVAYGALFLVLRVPSEHEIEIMRAMSNKVWNRATQP